MSIFRGPGAELELMPDVVPRWWRLWMEHRTRPKPQVCGCTGLPWPHQRGLSPHCNRPVTKG